MKKQKALFTALPLLLLTVLFSVLPTAAADFSNENPRVIDEAGLLTDAECEELSERLEEIRTARCMDIAVLTTDTVGNRSVADYAEAAFETYAYGYGDTRDGVLLLINMGERDWYIATHGYAIDCFSDELLDYIGEVLVPYLADGEYAAAFGNFADLCDEAIARQKEYDSTLGTIDSENEREYEREYEGTYRIPEEFYEFDEYLPQTFRVFSTDRLIVALVFGLIVALIVVLSMKSKLKSVRYRSEASDYLRDGSMQVTERQDLFLYHTVSRRARPQQNHTNGSSGSHHGGSTHVSSSGSSFGGRGGKF